ncbi:MAG TPA: flagellar export chaperone FlgN [Thermoclostridium sp.]|nr:flagellar export chaperone FlgN [Thermoclostridium sp.]
MQKQAIINEMMALSNKKYNMLIKLKELSKKQNEAFGEERLDSVENILNDKDALISDISEIDEAFIGHSDSLKKLLGISSLTEIENTNVEGRRELKELIECITNTVEEIIEIEKQGQDIAFNMRNSFSKEIKTLNSGKKMTTAYNNKPLNNPSYFFDKKK